MGIPRSLDLTADIPRNLAPLRAGQGEVMKGSGALGRAGYAGMPGPAN